MPFTVHGQDTVFINYFPMMFVESGVWDPYGFISADFPHFNFTYYGPVLFIIMSLANFLITKLFNPVSLVAMLEIGGTMLKGGFSTTDYVRTFAGYDLFRNLFLMKSPYLIFDFAIGWFLLKLALSKEFALTGYKLWMLNIVVLQSVYAVGGAYLIPAFFIIASLYAAVRKRPYLCIVFLSLGGATKLFPYVLIIPAALLLGHDWKKRFLLLLTSVAVSVIVYLPFYLSSGNSVLGLFTLSHMQYQPIITWSLRGVFVILYSFIVLSALKDSRLANPQNKLLYYFAMVLFLSYATFPMRFRYFVFITPLLALIIPRYKKMAIFTGLIVLMLAFLWLPERDLQLGLFAPLNVNYFLSLPTIQELVGRFVNIEIIYKALARILVLCFLAAASWIYCIKREEAAQC